MTKWRILDLETAAHPEAHKWADPAKPDPKLLEPIVPDSRLKDPAKVAANLIDVERRIAERPAEIEASIKERTEAQKNEFGLDADLCRIVALGYYDVGHGEPTVYLMRDEFEEREQLKMFWQSFDANATRFVGFNSNRFDLPVLLMRSLYLQVPHPSITIAPAWKTPHVDLWQYLSLDGARDKRDVKGLAFYLRRFGIEVHDKVKGSEIQQLVNEEKWNDIHNHCLSDIGGTHALGIRLGLLPKLAEKGGVMAIIPGQFCERCAEREETPVPAEHELDSWGVDSGGGGFLCGNCYTNAAEAAHESRLSDYYGGSGPVTINEQYQAAAKERRELRRRD